MNNIDLSLCKKCSKASQYTGYEKDTKENFRVLICTLTLDNKPVGIERLDEKGDDTNNFTQEPESKPPLDCPYLLEHVLEEQV